ncbi:MAG TPA: SDR family oxidoreductase [Longimicrobium sp.]|jgi:NAD(P)-dependent dehydrogenase (short-subunit alcohol dehydrogenase family)
MRGRVCVVTGASAGIGKATAAGLARLGATVVLLVRSRERGEAARAEIAREAPGADVHLVLADLSAQAEVRRAAEEILGRFPRVHVLVNNAATFSWRRKKTVDGIERQWAVNHLAPFLLTHLLLARLAESAPARVVAVSSNSHFDGRLRWDDLQMERGFYRGLAMYARSKLANVLFTRELARRARGTGVTANAMHPGVVATSLLLDGFPPLKLLRRRMRTPEEGARTAVWLAASPEAEALSGEYCIDERPVRPSAAALDDEAARRLWDVSAETTGLA